MTSNVLVNLRKRTFANIPDIEKYREITELVKQFPSHSFLANANGFITYTYLVNYVCSISEAYFNRPISSIKILDWGAGKGHISYLFIKKGASQLVSCDINHSKEDSTFGQETPIIKKFDIKIVPLRHEYILPFEDSCFDVVLSFGVLEHVSNEIGSLKEINRILNTGGLFFCFNLPYYLSYTQKIAHLKGDFYHDRLYSKKKVRQLLAESKFDLRDIWFRNLFPKNSADFKHLYKHYERLDQIISNYTPLKYFSTSLEFLAAKT